MGISNNLQDAYGDSLPIMFVAFSAIFVSYIRSLLLVLIHSPVRVLHTAAPLAGNQFLTHIRAAFPSFPFSSPSDLRPDCVICLSRIADRERVRRLYCCHVFHAECLDAWFLINLSCPLCRSPLDLPLPKSLRNQKYLLSGITSLCLLEMDLLFLEMVLHLPS